MSRLSTLTLSAAPLAALVLAGCGGMTMTDQLCSEENHCVRDGDDVVCEEGYEWENPDDAENYNCIDRCVDANFCQRVDGVVGCQDGYQWGPDGESAYLCVEIPTGVDVLGSATHDLGNVIFEEVASRADGLRIPRDLEFHPVRTDELWVVNYENSSATVLFDMGTNNMSGQSYGAFGNLHFLAQPAGIAFSDGDFFATAQEEDDLTQGPVELGGSPEDFMGPTLWTADLSIFDGGHGGHMDILHNSPNSVGIAWEVDNVYWVYDGWHGALTKYNFNSDHGPGGADHSDGTIYRYVDGQMGYVEGVSSGLVFDHATGYLYAADSANNRIMVLDTNTGSMGSNIFPNYDGVVQRQVVDAMLMTVIDGSDVDNMVRPSGLEMHDGHLYVTDNATGYIFAFSLDGELVDYIDTGLPDGALQSIAFKDNGDLYMVDSNGERIFRMAPAPTE